MSKRNDQYLLEDIVEAISRILKYTEHNDYESFIKDEKTIDAVIRNFEIIGEAANRISPELKQEKKNVPWRMLSDFRNRLIHEYFGVDLGIIWDIVETELKDLLVLIKA